MGERRQLVHVDGRECLGVGGDDTKEIVGLTHYAGRFDDLVAAGVLPPVFAASDDPERLVPIVTRPERIRIAVAGDRTRTNAFSNEWPHGWRTTKVVGHTPASDVVCSVDGSCRIVR